MHGLESPSRGSESSDTIEVPFNENASRSRDGTAGSSGEEEEGDSRDSGEERLRPRRYQKASAR